jgi:DNA-binding transcriptional LysR family regulator
MIDPDYILFARVVEAGSLAGAARRLGVSAPLASRRLMRLESRLGVALVHRTTRRMELTSHGSLFYADVARIIAAAEEAEARLTGARRRPAGPLRLTVPTSFGRLHIAPTLQPFLVRHPDVDLTVHLSDAYTDLIAERFDLAVRITSEVGPDLHAVWLADSRRVLCASPAYLARHGVPETLADLEHHELLAAEGQLPWRLSAAGREVVVAGQSSVRTNSSEVVRELALSGVGVALRSLWEVSGELGAGRLVRVLPSVEGSREAGIFAVRPRAAFVSAAVEAFTAHLRDLLQPRPPWDELT